MPDTPAQLADVSVSFAGGENHVAHETNIPEGFARSVEDFDLYNSGVASTRPVLEHVTGTEAHSIWRAPTLGITVLVEQDKLAILENDSIVYLEDSNGDNKIAGSRSRMYFDEYNEEVYFTNGWITGIVGKDKVLRTWGVKNPVTPNASESTNEVRYLTYQDAFGRESGGVRFDVGSPPFLDGLASRLYIADEDSSVLRLNGTGKQLTTQERIPMPAGRYLAFHGGRAFVARGVFLFYSDPLNVELCDPRYNFEAFPSPITNIASVQSGLYVTTTEGVYYLQGADPGAWAHVRVGELGAIPGSGVIVPIDSMSPEAVPRGVSAHYVFAYLTRSGLAFGWDRGEVQEPTADRLRLPTDVEVSMSLVQRDGYYQFVAVPQHPVNAAVARALDTPVT